MRWAKRNLLFGAAVAGDLARQAIADGRAPPPPPPTELLVIDDWPSDAKIKHIGFVFDAKDLAK